VAGSNPVAPTIFSCLNFLQVSKRKQNQGFIKIVKNFFHRVKGLQIQANFIVRRKHFFIGISIA
ncbi:MAG TPA: hypothetical protein VKJ65_12535, partial [Phycisphaerae bacterium]|nr:hypothetical protein [Phycisphaerae bacterium]